MQQELRAASQTLHNSSLGKHDSPMVGERVGDGVGAAVGGVGAYVGSGVGAGVGVIDGAGVGAVEGTGVGAGVAIHTLSDASLGLRIT